MPVQPSRTRTVPRTRESVLHKTKQRLIARGLLQVFDTFPPTHSFTFHEANWRGKKALKFHLGHRLQVVDADDPDLFAESWAYIILEQCKIEPPVMVQDEGPELTGNRSSYPRSASSLLCKAHKIFPPFCFLQTESPANPRNKLCALVLYYALVNGISDAAIKWNLFEDSLVDAIAYIEQRAEYQLWRREQDNDQDATLSATSDAAQSNEMDEPQTKGGVVRSVGSSVSIRSGTALDRLLQTLGNERMQLLDLIPPHPVTIKRYKQDGYWPFRLNLGVHAGSNVYVYRKYGKKRTEFKIMPHGSDADGTEWQFNDLRGIQLLEPFARLMKIKNDLITRGNKIRYLVYYYLMLAGNEGLIDDPELQVSPSTMIATFVSVCRNLGKAEEVTDEDGKVEVQAQVEEDLGISAPEQKSLILRLRVHPEMLAILNETVDVGQELCMPGNLADEMRGSPNTDQDRQSTTLSSSQPCSVPAQSPLVQYSDSDDDLSLQARAQSAKMRSDESHDTEANGIEEEKDDLRMCTDVFHSPIGHAAADHFNTYSDLPMEGVAHRAARQASTRPEQDERVELPSLSPESDGTDVSHVRNYVTKKNIPFLIVSSDDMEATRPTPRVVQLPSRAAATPQLPRDSEIINLCSDDEDSVMGGSLKAEVDGTPDFEDELRWPSQKRKRREIQEISDDEDDDVLEEVDGDAWRRASFRQS